MKTLIFTFIFMFFIYAQVESKELTQQSDAKSPQEAVERLIKAYSSVDLKSINKSLGENHRFGSNVIDGLKWLGNCLTIMNKCINNPIEVIETKQFGAETAIAVLAKNLLGSPMSVWFITIKEQSEYKVTGMDTKLKCALKTPEEKIKDRKDRKFGDYDIC